MGQCLISDSGEMKHVTQAQTGALTIIATWKRNSKKLVVKQSLIQKVSHKSLYDKHMLAKKVDIQWCLENSKSGYL